MPRHHLRDFLPRMRERGAPWHLHYETKANLKDREVKLCSEAGVVALQPGIESLSSDVLKLMCKGVRAMQNVLVIYTMTRYRIIPAYNFIFGFPFEVPKFYFNILKLIPALHHLHPPETVVPALITRFAPLHEDPERFGGKGPLVAHHRYEHVFSKDYRRKVNLFDVSVNRRRNRL
jgi:hypothetical protein